MSMGENTKNIVDRKEIKKMLQKVRHNISLEAMINLLKMRYFGHVMREHQSLEKDTMLGITTGARRKGSPVCVGWTTSKV